MAKAGKSKRPEPPKKPADPAERLLAAAMEVAVRIGWRRAALADIAAAAEISLGELHSRYADKAAILRGIVELADKKVLDGAGEPDPESSPRDRLFDVLMRRLEAMRGEQQAIRSLLRSIPRHPGLALALNCLALRSQRWMLEAAGIDSAGRLGQLRAQGLAVLYARVLRTFVHDHDEGLAPTMAALDRELARGQRLSGLLDCFCRFAPSPRHRARRRMRDDDFPHEAIV